MNLTPKRLLAALAVIGMGQVNSAQAQTNPPAKDSLPYCYEEKKKYLSADISHHYKSTMRYKNSDNPRPYLNQSMTIYPTKVADNKAGRFFYPGQNPPIGNSLFVDTEGGFRGATGTPQDRWGIFNIGLVTPTDRSGNLIKAARVRVTSANGALVLYDKLETFSNAGESQYAKKINIATVENQFKWMAGTTNDALIVSLYDPENGELNVQIEYAYDVFKTLDKLSQEQGGRVKAGHENHLCKARLYSPGCFLTTAACDIIGLEDDCWELQTLRQFRDNWLACQDEGHEDIEAYYRLAPTIIAAINMRSDAQRLWLQHYWRHILPSAILIKFGAMRTARKVYSKMMYEMMELAGL